MKSSRFSDRVIAWQRAHGRHDLPWQNTRDPYAIWISEIMLQQTQVATVIPYYRRFMARFATVDALAAATLDDVLAHWSGLGYYSRARNLHRAARIVCAEHGGIFPREIERVSALPGIGRSTAAAIVVFAYGARHAILDGNVKRVLARIAAIDGYPGERRVSERLWCEAEQRLPRSRIEAYTQGLMDLGATICVRRAPLCAACPVSELCRAFETQRVRELPCPRPRKRLPSRRTVMLVLERAGAVLFEKRPAVGVWAGLWCFPEIAPDGDIDGVCAQRFGVRVSGAERLSDVRHGFTHFSLTIAPWRVTVSDAVPIAAEADRVWLTAEQARRAAVPAPVVRILDAMAAVELPLREGRS